MDVVFGIIWGGKFYRILVFLIVVFWYKGKLVWKKKRKMKNNCGRNLGKCIIIKGKLIEYGIIMEEKWFELIFVFC